MTLRVFIPMILLSALGLALFAACGGGGNDGDTNGDAVETATTVPDDGDAAETATAVQADDEDGASDDGNGGGEVGTASATADGVTTALTVFDCIPPEGDGSILVSARNDDEDAILTLAGIAGAVNADFSRGEEQWVAVGAFLEVDGSTFSYDGPALKFDADPPDSELAFEVTC